MTNEDLYAAILSLKDASQFASARSDERFDRLDVRFGRLELRVGAVVDGSRELRTDVAALTRRIG